MELRIGFIEEVKGIIENSRIDAIRSVDHVRVKMYWELGRKIFEEEQKGEKRAEYGIFLLKIFQMNCLQFMVNQLVSVNLKDIDSFINCSQLRPHCGRNLVGHITSYY